MHLHPKLLRAAVYGANDGIVTTFAVVAGVMGAGLSAKVILILGIANMLADGLSMGIGDYLGETSERRSHKQSKSTQTKAELATWSSGLSTIISFNIAGSIPLVPFVLGAILPHSLSFQTLFHLSIFCTGFALFLVGFLRTKFIGGKWWINGLEMLTIGSIAAVVAFVVGALIEQAL